MMNLTQLRIFIFTLFSTAVAFTASAQGEKTLETRIADILNEMPARDIGQLEFAMQQMAELPEAGLNTLVGRLVALDGKEDTRIRYALESYTRYITGDLKPEKVEQFYRILFNHLPQATDPELRLHMLLMQRYYPDSRFLNEYRKALGDPFLAPHAIMLLEGIHNEASVEVLKEAFENNPELRPQLVKTLMKEGDFSVVNTVLNDLRSGAGRTYATNGHAYLAASLQPVAYSYLGSQAEALNYNLSLDSTRVLSSLADMAVIAGAQNRGDLLDMITEVVLENYDMEEGAAHRIRVVEANARENPKGVEKLIKDEHKRENDTYRAHILQIAAKYNIPVREKHIIKAYRKSGEVYREGAVHYAEATRNSDLLNELIGYTPHVVGYPHADLMVAKVKLDGDGALDFVLEELRDPNMISHSEKALSILLSPKKVPLVLGELNTGRYSPGAQAFIIKMAAEKASRDQFTLFSEFTDREDGLVREAAYRALARLASEENIDALIDMLEDSEEVYHPFIAEGLAVAITELDSEEEMREAVEEVYDRTGNAAFISLLAPQVGTGEVYRFFREVGASEDLRTETQEAMTRWPDRAAVPDLIDMWKAGDYEGESLQLLGALLRQIVRDDIPDDQQLLYLRDLMENTEETQGRNMVLRALSVVKTYPAFAYAQQFLSDADHRNTAARVLMNMALPTPGKEDGLYGTLVRAKLLEVMGILEGNDAPYARADVQTYLENMREGEGFTSMFNGEDLSGWKGFVADPLKLVEMSERQLTRAQRAADEKLSENWSVKDGAIVFSGEGQNLVSVKDYGDFELYVDWKITKGGDSGIYLRGAPQVQIWDIARVESGADVGSGGLYNNQENESDPLVVADNPVGEWNTFRILMRGAHVSVWLNGILVVDSVKMENYWNRSQPIFPTGPIELQAHGTDLAFRDIYIREISSPDFGLTAEEKEEGFVSLFDGATLSGWTGNKADYAAEDGMIVVKPQGGGRGNLYTEKEYDNFILRFEFQLTPGANNGVGIHAPLEGDVAYVGKEIQVLDNTAAIYSNLKEWQYHGSVYGVMAARRGQLRPVGEWNEEEIRVDGNRITVTLNGEVILDGDYEEASKDGTLDGIDHPGLDRKKGHIGFLGHGSVVRYRNLRIKEL